VVQDVNKPMKPVSLVIFLLIFFWSAQGQNKIPILERKITVELVNEKLPDALSRIAQEAKFSFSYNSSIISNDQIVNLNLSDKTVRDVLNEVFKGTIDYKQKSNHLILTKVIVKPIQTTTTISVIVSGYVEDAVTKEKIANASVYDKKSITSVVTDEFGFFKMKLERKEQTASIAVSKRDYRDTLVTITAPGNQYLTISIEPLGKDSLIVKATTTEQDSLKKEELPLPYDDEPNIQNISDTLYRDIQISFLPFLGSNGSLSGNVINNYSINILGGYSLGTRQIELGFFANIDRGDVSWLQIAGLGNLVGGNVYGIQASGFFNVNGGETKAAQLTGFGNVNFHDFQGVQLAGFGNVNLRAADGVQVAGFGNLSMGPSKGVQIAGFGNLQTHRFNGSQIAGASNLNMERITGSQISALFNYGKVVHGTQIGLFNFADSLGGAPIGLVSFVKSGYHKLEVSADEVFYTNVAFRTGVQKFYNILLAGIKPEKTINDVNVWTFGYGIGTAPRLGRRLQLNLDLTSQHVSKGDFTSQLSLLNKVHVGVDYTLARKFSIYGGLTLNGYLTNSSYTDYPVLFNGYSPSIISDHTFNNGTNLKMWFGAKVGLRFL
jgi:Secretin and TonB N terminus short domain